MLLGTDLAYTEGKSNLVVTSFTKSGTDEDTDRAKHLASMLGTIAGTEPQTISLDGLDYFVGAVAMPRKSTRSLDASYGKDAKGSALIEPRAIVLAAMVPTDGNASIVKTLILLASGLGSLAIATASASTCRIAG